MKILLLSPNYFPEKVGIGKYNKEFVDLGIKLGHSFCVITGHPYYPYWKVIDGYDSLKYKSSDAFNEEILRCPIYVPAKLNVKKRLIHLASFALSSFFGLFKAFKFKPDVIMLIQPTIFCAPSVLLYSKILGCKSVMHVQDFEVDAMYALKNIDKISTSQKIVSHFESYLYGKFDYVSSISHKMCMRLKDKCRSKSVVLHFPNWVDLEFVKPSGDKDFFNKRFDFDKDIKIVLYSGNIGEKQGLDIVLDVALRMAAEKVRFVFVGEGSYKKSLEERCELESIKNVAFFPLQEWEDFPSMLRSANVHIVIQKKGFADAVLPSKLSNILAVGGNCVVSAEQNTELELIHRENPGIYELCIPENIDSLYTAIMKLLASPNAINHVARDYAFENLAAEKIVSEYLNAVAERNIVNLPVSSD